MLGGLSRGYYSQGLGFPLSIQLARMVQTFRYVTLDHPFSVSARRIDSVITVRRNACIGTGDEGESTVSSGHSGPA